MATTSASYRARACGALEPVSTSKVHLCSFRCPLGNFPQRAFFFGALHAGEETLKKSISIAATILLTAVTLFAAEDWRGTNRVNGSVVDKNTGAPVKGATVKLRKGPKGGPDITTDASGKWAVLGIGAGGWNIDVEAPGYVTRQMSIGI